MSVYPAGTKVRPSAEVSADDRYRYHLERDWSDPADDAKLLPFIMLNPSIANAELDDPTIRRCVGLAWSHGYTGIFVVNLFAYRTSKPSILWRDMDAGIDVVGPKNDGILEAVMSIAGDLGRPVVAAWGAAPRAGQRVKRILELAGARNLHAFGVTNSGAPRHPLYLRSDCELTPWTPA